MAAQVNRWSPIGVYWKRVSASPGLPKTQSTGGTSSEFAAYEKAKGSTDTEEELRSFDAQEESEGLLDRLVTELAKHPDGTDVVIQCIVKVTVGGTEEIKSSLFDWRRICRWELVDGTLHRFEPQESAMGEQVW